MSYSIILLPEAEEDIYKARNWYQNESPGLEDQFWNTVLSILQNIGKYPTRFSPGGKDVRIAYVKKFPYKVIFYINESMKRVEIIAIVHNKRHPRVWKRRL